MIGEQGEITEDGKLSWLEVECLGACVNAPMVQINDDFYEDLTAEKFEQILNDLRQGNEVATGPQNSRRASEPEGGLTVLKGDNIMLRDEDRIFQNIYGFAGADLTAAKAAW